MALDLAFGSSGVAMCSLGLDLGFALDSLGFALGLAIGLALGSLGLTLGWLVVPFLTRL